jgi:HD superfamily phosphohydrolase
MSKIIKDPVHRFMVFNESQDLLGTLKEVCDHPQFQRLRRIKQLE